MSEATVTTHRTRVLRSEHLLMRFRADRRRLSVASRALALLAATAAVLGQFLALSHEIAVRHARCAEHGEITHVQLAGATATATPPAIAGLWAQKGEPRPGHEHCTTALTLHSTAGTRVYRHAIQSPPVPAPIPVWKVPPARDRAFLLASAPKTSPPSV